MKTAIYIEDGIAQIVLTPETEFEKTALKTFGDGQTIEVNVFRGTFYDCQGGWTRQSLGAGIDSDRSIIIRTISPTHPAP